METTAKLEKCEVCDNNEAKYTCPKCEVRTCCLTCVRIHKKVLNCDGIRDKTKFVPLNKFKDLDLLSDYRLLEELGRSVDRLQRDGPKTFKPGHNIPTREYKLKQAASHSGIKLEFLPKNFSRHQQNFSYYNCVSKELCWTIEWIFPQAENIKWTTKKVLDTTRLSELVENILDPLNSLLENDHDEATRRILSDKLQFYRSAGLSGLEILLKAEKVKKSSSRFYKLDLTSCLRENLSNKNIIEFPTLFVVFKDHVDMYEIIDSDGEDEKDLIEQPQNRNNKRKKYNQNNKKSDKRPVNYLFHHDSSDSEEESHKNNGNFNLSSIPDYNEFVRM